MRTQQKIALAAVLVLLGTFAAAGWGEEQEGGYIEYSQGVYHTVKKGDTLWDLSKRFYDQPSLWPDLWSNNPDIPNPHWIYPGQIITLYQRTDREWVPAGDPNAVRAQAASGYVIHQKTIRIPALDEIGFIQEDPVPSSGVIVKGNIAGVLISTGVTVYVKPVSTMSYAEGDRFTIWRNEGVVMNPYKGIDRPLGVKHRIMGQMVVTHVGPEIITGRVEDSYDGIQAGDLLMPPRAIRDEPIALKPGKPGVEGHIAATEDNLTLIGDGHVVFLDVGRKDGVEVGQIYTAYYKQDPIREADDTMIALPDIDAAQVLVLSVEAETSTAVVLRSPEILQTGALIRADSLPLR